MVIPQNYCPAPAFGAVRRDQRSGIDLEMAQRIVGDVGAGDSTGDCSAFTQEQAATLAGICSARLGKEHGADRRCDPNVRSC